MDVRDPSGTACAPPGPAGGHAVGACDRVAKKKGAHAKSQIAFQRRGGFLSQSSGGKRFQLWARLRIGNDSFPSYIAGRFFDVSAVRPGAFLKKAGEINQFLHLIRGQYGANSNKFFRSRHAITLAAILSQDKPLNGARPAPDHTRGSRILPRTAGTGIRRSAPACRPSLPRRAIGCVSSPVACSQCSAPRAGCPSKS